MKAKKRSRPLPDPPPSRPAPRRRRPTAPSLASLTVGTPVPGTDKVTDYCRTCWAPITVLAIKGAVLEDLPDGDVDGHWVVYQNECSECRHTGSVSMRDPRVSRQRIGAAKIAMEAT